MSNFQIGDRIKIKNSSNVGTIKSIFDEASYFLWSGTVDYLVELDNFEGTVTVAESALEPFDFVLPTKNKCQCGVGVLGSGKHSTWCILYEN